MRPHRLPTLAGRLAVTSLALISLSGAPQAAASTVSLVPLAIVAPHSPKDSAPDPACTTPAPAATFGEFHCYTPDQISAAYGVDPLPVRVPAARPPPELLGVPGLPTLLKGFKMAIAKYPAGTVFSQSFGLSEQTFGGAALSQMQAFDQTYQNGINKGDSFLAASGDQGNGGGDKNHKFSGVYSFNVVGVPAVTPLVTALGVTPPMLGWKLAPTSNDPIA